MKRFVSVCVGVLIAVSALAAQTSDDMKEDQRILKQLGLASDGKSLLDYLRKQTFPEADPGQMDALMVQLGDEDFKTRETAHVKLLALGKSAIVGLKEAEKSVDAEVRMRAKDLREKVEAKVEPSIQRASARLIARLKPEGSADVLLAFLPFAADLAVTDEVCKALGAVAIGEKGVEPAIVKALDDKHPTKRGAAGEALARAKAEEVMPNVRKLLKDPEPIVRVRTASALIQARDRTAIDEAVPVLIECLKHLPPENLWGAEDILVRLAGEGNVPSVSLGTNERAQEQCYQAWEAWYEKNRQSIALAKLDLSEPMLGNTLIVYQSVNRIVALNGVARRQMLGEVIEVDRNKKILWKLAIEDSYASDAMVLPGQTGEVVVAELTKQRVTIRETKTNKVVWEHTLNGMPINVQALPQGKIMVTLQTRIFEIDRATKEEKTIVAKADGAIYRAKKTKNGDVVYVTNTGVLRRVNAKGAVLKEFQVPNVATVYGSIDILPNGNILIPDFQQMRVVEYDTNGTQISQLATPLRPNTAARLPQGHTLVSSMNASTVTEFNRAGQAVWSFDVEGQVYNTRRR